MREKYEYDVSKRQILQELLFVNGGVYMFCYIVNDSKSEKHFNKTYDLEMLKADSRGLLEKHAYRIKDVTEAINTSVLIDVDKKQTYNNWLTSDVPQFDASEEFVEICKELGECDIY